MDSINYELRDNFLKVVLTGINYVKDFKDIEDLLNNNQDIKKLEIDMHLCSTLQSRALAELIYLKKRSTKEGFEISLLNVTEGTENILEMSNLRSLFNLTSDYGIYSVNELITMLQDPAEVEFVSDYLSDNYDNDIRDKLHNVVSSSDIIRSEYALLIMGRAQDYESIRIIRNCLNSEYNNIKRSAILVLGWLGDITSKSKIYSYLESSEIDIAEAAAASIAMLSNEEDSDKLKIYLNNRDYRIRIIAVQALSLINDNKSYKYLRDQLDKESDENVRLVLVRRLSLYNKDEVVDILIKFLDDISIGIREAAAAGIIRVGPRGNEYKILEKVTDTDSWVGFFATKALLGTYNKDIIDKLIQAYDSVEDNVKLAIIEVVGQSKYADEKFLALKISNTNEDIRKEALNAMANVNSEKALEFALKLYNTDKSWLVRYMSVDIIINSKPLGYKSLLKEQIDKEDNRDVRDKLIYGFGE